MITKSTGLFLVLLMLSYCLGCAPASPPPPLPPLGVSPFEPDSALATFEMTEGFQVELVIAEPHIADPVAIDIDEKGRIWVVEMPGYPLNTEGSGRVRLLEDTDGDGHPDRSSLFADNLVLPTGIMRWKQGVLVTDPPDLIYLEDTTGDGTADVREVILTGFARSNPQHNFNKPLYGLDNWIYLANNGTIWWTEKFKDEFGGRGETIAFPDHPDGPNLGRNALDRNVRFQPDHLKLESLSGRSQFGHTFDAWGHHFLVSNANHQYHEVLAARYFARNPDLPIRQAMEITPVLGDPAAVYPVTLNPDHQLLTDRGVFTSACGITYYLGGLFPAPYENVTFVAEPVHNLIHTDLVENRGATFTATPVEDRREFLASKDGWFRPVNFSIGPDGALYVVDYYRQIVEHPEWMDEETAASGDLLNGIDRGRIYRITPTGTPPLDWYNQLTLDQASSAELVEHLGHANHWWRLHAQRLLVDRQDSLAIPLLNQRLEQEQRPESRVHLLWTLEGLEALEADKISTALQDEAAGVRENALVLAEIHLANAPQLAEDVLSLAEDPHPRVRFQLLNTLGFLVHPDVAEIRQSLLQRDMEDEWTQTAALLALPENTDGLFDDTMVRFAGQKTPGRAAYFSSIAMIVGSGKDSEQAGHLLEVVLTDRSPFSSWWRSASLKGLAQGLRRNQANLESVIPRQQLLYTALLAEPDVHMRDAFLQVLKVLPRPDAARRGEILATAIAFATSDTEGLARRADMVNLVALIDPTPYEAQLKDLLQPTVATSIQKAVIHALGKISGTESSTYLLSNWNSLSPELRDAGIDVLMQDRDRILLLLDALEAKTVQPSTLGWNRTVVMMRDLDEDLLIRARELLSEKAHVRAEALTTYQDALTLSGYAERGEIVFQQTCATCHQVNGGRGTAYGPDLGTVRHWSGEALLTGILDPEENLADGYDLWFINKQDGQQVSGIIAAETPNAYTVWTAPGVEVVVPRTEVQEMTSSSISLMPAGLEQQISEQEMADLLAFLRTGR